MTSPSLFLGAVAYDAKVVSIWEGTREHFHAVGVPMDFALFSNYERQVDALMRGHIDVAWNTPLAHVRVKRRTEDRSVSLAMRDTDRDFTSKLVVRKDAGIRSIADLVGKRLAVGSRDSTQARILPLYFLGKAGVPLTQVKVLPFDSDLGKHGDTGRSELDALDAVSDGRADAAVLGDLIWATEQSAGRVDASRVEAIWTSPSFDHCMFDAMPSFAPERAEAFRRALFAMKWEVPEHRRLLELEGLRQWLPPREEGYASLREALLRDDA
jgi:ABC-type phosphate/phosphonate transport system substrate-binding protein